MKRSRVMLGILGGVILTAAVSAACSDSPLAPADDLALNVAGASVTVTSLTATDVFTGLVDPGLVEVREYHFVARGVVVTSRITATDPRGTCNARITANEQLLMADGSGQVWGKFECDADVGGVWVASWTGQREPGGAGVWIATIKVVGHGVGGAIDGLQLRAEELVYQNAPFLGPHFGQITGTILQPN